MADLKPDETPRQKQLASKLKSLRQQQETLRRTPVAAPPPKEKGMSVGGFGENILDDAGDLLKGLFLHLPVAAWHGAKKAIKDPSVLGDIQADRVLGAVKDAIVEPYQKHGLKVAYYRPLSTTLDALAVWGLAAKSAGLASKVSGSARGLEFAREMEALPGKLAGGAVESVAKKFGVDLKARREFLGEGKRVENSRKMVKIIEDDARVSRRLSELNAVEREEFDLIRKKGHQPTDPPINPKVAEALDATESVVKEWQDELIARGKLTPEIIEEVKVKKYAAEAGDLSKEGLEKARQAIASADRKPFYGPALQDAGNVGVDLDDFFRMPQAEKMGKPGFLQKFESGFGAIKDPAVYFPRAIRAFREYEYRMRLAERVAQNPKWSRVLKAGETAKAGETPINEVVPKAFREGESLAKGAVSSQAKEFDAVTMKNIAEAKNIVIANDTVRRLLKWEYMRQPGGIVKVYDAILGAFKSGATRYNPHWMTGNIIGDAIMSVLFGREWKLARELRKKGLGPLETAARPTMAMESGQLGQRVEKALHVHGLLEGMGSLAAAADDAYRMKLITPEVVRNMKQIDPLFEASAQTLGPIMKSSENFSEVAVRLQLMGEEISKRSPQIQKIDTTIERLQKLDQKLDKRLVGHEEKRIAKNKAVKNQTDEVYAPISKQQPKAPSDMEYEIGLKRQLIHQRIGNLQEARGQIVRDIQEMLVKTGKLQEQIPGLQAQMNVLVPAIDRANAFVGEYVGLSGFEQQVMRRIIPFYSWAKAMNMLAFRLPFIAPVKTFAWNRFGAAMMSLVGDNELPPYAKGYLPVFALEDGSMGWVKFGSFSPFGSVKPSKVGDIPVPGPLNLAQSNPIIGLAFKAFGGENLFQQTNIPYGSKMVNIHNGDTYEFTQQGTVKKVIPQDPMISSILHMFPLTQFVEQVLTPYRATQHNAIGLPIPAFNPDGSYKYPRELWERLSTLVGIPMAKRDREQMIQAQKYRIYKIVQTYKNAYRRATPDQQKFIREVLSDYQRGQLREIE